MFNDKSNVYGVRTSLSMSIINDDPFFCPYTNISTITNAIVSTVSKQQNYMEPYATEYIQMYRIYTRNREKTDNETLAKADCDL